MPREPRIEYAGAIYHVMNRGNHLESIFKDDKDRAVFIKTLEETCLSSGWAVHSFVLMGNHYHLLIETNRATLVKGMQYLNSTYTQRYNSRHQTRGHLFQGRYKALLVDGEAKGYFLTVSDYIHMNPVRAKKVNDIKLLLKDPWSSAGWLAGSHKKCPIWLRWERVYGELGLQNWRSKARREFRDYLAKRMSELGGEEWKRIRRGWCFGSEEFGESLKERLIQLKGKQVRDRESWAGDAVEEMEEHLAIKILHRAAKRLGHECLNQVKGMDRILLAKHVRTQTKVSVKWIAMQLGYKTRSGLASNISKLTKTLLHDKRLARKWNSL